MSLSFGSLGASTRLARIVSKGSSMRRFRSGSRLRGPPSFLGPGGGAGGAGGWRRAAPGSRRAILGGTCAWSAFGGCSLGGLRQFSVRRLGLDWLREFGAQSRRRGAIGLFENGRDELRNSAGVDPYVRRGILVRVLGV